jgi:coenzyme F420-reducing hydrogenase alpha subunit
VSATRSIDVPVLARVEGEGALHVRVRDGQVDDVALSIYEPPRFFEGFLVGRAAAETPDITARICGICPVAYQVAAANAVEASQQVDVGETIRAMRRLLYCGEWIESHALHIYLLHAPDFLGYPDAITLAADHREVVQQGLRLKKIGNTLMEVVGGRAIHPVNPKVGGFYRFPTDAELAHVRPLLDQAAADATATVRLVAGLDLPDVTQPYHFVALDPENGDYPLEDGRHVLAGTDRGGRQRFPLEEFDTHVTEIQVEHSHALHARLDGVGSYLVGPQARWALMGDRMTGAAANLAAELSVPDVVTNPFASIVVRALEVVYAVEEAARIIDEWLAAGPGGHGPSSVDVPAGAGIGYGASEAPRGLLVHRYRTDEAGLVADARIVPPTSQNQAQIEADVRKVVAGSLDLDDAALTHRAEVAIRNYDPCISCATHALTLTIDRG